MKASLKFREEQKPLFKAKVPLSILGLPFQSGLSAGDSKELSLSLSTFFDSGPAFRVSYRPNDAFNPFSLSIKTGIGSFGSPFNDAPMTISAEFNFLSQNSKTTPSFFLRFKPQFGDFSLKKSQQSSIPLPVFSEDKNEMEDIEVVENPDKKKVAMTSSSSVQEAMMTGMQVGARTSMPITNGAVLRLRWGIKFPEGLKSVFKRDESTGRISPRGVPLLVLNKIGIEHVANNKKENNNKEVVVGPGLGRSEAADVAESCFAVKRQLEMLRAENSSLGKALEDLRVEFRGRGERKLGDRESEKVGVMEHDVSNKGSNVVVKK